MQKKSLAAVISAVMMMSIAGCGSTSATSVSVTSEISVETGSHAESSEETAEVTVNPRKVKDEGYVYEGDGYSFEVRWCEEEGAKIFGRMYYPDNFDESKTYPVMILCHGNNGVADSWDYFFAPEFSKAGYLCYAIDARSSTDKGRGTYSDPLENVEESTAGTFAVDMEAGIDFVKTLPFVNSEQIFLMGQSKGGIAAQLAAADRANDVAGLIVLYGALTKNDTKFVENYDEYAKHRYTGPVLIVNGTEDASSTKEKAEECASDFENSELILIEGAKHGFGRQPDEYATEARDGVLAFMEKVTAE